MTKVSSAAVVLVASKDKAISNLPALAEMSGFEYAPTKLTLVKPNICGMYPPSLELIESVIRSLKPFAQTLVIGETPSAMHTPEERFASLGIDEAARRHGAAIQNLMRNRVVHKPVPKPHALSAIPLPSTVVEADLLVNCPGLGRHGSTLLTCALKNLFGLVAEPHKYSSLHPRGVSEVIADVFQVVKPRLNVVDCGRRVLVGTDALSVDLVACEIGGLTPSRVRHLVLAAQDRGLDIGSLEVERLEA